MSAIDPKKTTRGLSFPAGNAGEELRRLMLEEAATPIPLPPMPAPEAEAGLTPNDHLITPSDEALMEVSSEVSIKPSKEVLRKTSSAQMKRGTPVHGGAVTPEPRRRAVEELSRQGGGEREPVMRLNVELTESLHLKLKEYCVRRRVPIRSLVTALIEDFLAEQEDAR